MGKKIRKRSSERSNFVYSQEEDQWVVDTTFLNSLQEYDENGNLLKEANYNAVGDFDTLNYFKYDEKGFLVEELVHIDENEVAETHRVENREDGKPVCETIEYQDGSIDTVTFSYDENGNLVAEKQVDSDGLVESHEVYEYQDGMIVHEAVYGPEETILSENKHTYNEKGKLTETISWNSEEDQEIKVINNYGENDQLIETLRYLASGLLIARSNFTYNEKGVMTDLEEEDQNGIRRTKMETDEKGNMTLQEEYNEEGDLNLRIERSYNEEGEPLESTIYMDRHGNGADVYYTVKYEYEYF
jgi:hypothetical protein